MYKKIIIGFLLIAMFSFFTGARTFAKNPIQDLKDKIDENSLYLNSHSGFLATFEEKVSKAIKNKDNNLNLREIYKDIFKIWPKFKLRDILLR